VNIVGGGYAGLAIAIELKRLGYLREVVLYDSRSHHQNITQWHKLARGARVSRYQVPFADLAKKFSFRFSQENIDIDKLNRGDFAIAHGARSAAKPAGVVTLDDLRDDGAIQERIQGTQGERVTVVGGGPTGVQFAFEFAARKNRVTLIEARDRLLPLFDNALGQTALRAAERAGIEVKLNTEYKSDEQATELVLFVPGVRAMPSYSCDQFGRVENNNGKRIYAAGDNSHFAGLGLNTKSAQAAVRKGQQVARTIMADLVGRKLMPYNYAELGYFVSLGPQNAVGYLLSQKTAFSGRAALLMKEAIEKQYDLYLAGFQVYPG